MALGAVPLCYRVGGLENRSTLGVGPAAAAPRGGGTKVRLHVFSPHGMGDGEFSMFLCPVFPLHQPTIDFLMNFGRIV